MKNIWKIALGIVLMTSGAIGYEFTFSPKAQQLVDQDIITTPVDIINIKDIDQDTLTKIMEGSAPQLALEINKNETIPLNLFLNGDFIELIVPANTALTLKTKKNLYFRNAWGNFLFSTDGSEWKPLSDSISGSMFILLDVDKPGSPSLSFGMELNENEEN